MAFTVKREDFGKATCYLPNRQQRSQVGTAPNFSCSIVDYATSPVVYPLGYSYRLLTLDQPGVRKSKPYQAITYNFPRPAKQQVLTWGGASSCGNIVGWVFSADSNYYPVPGAIVKNANSPTQASIATPAGMQSAATIAAYNKLRDVKLDIAEFLGEFIETRNMVMDGFAKGARMVAAIATRDYRGFAKLAYGVHRQKRWLRHPEYKALRGRLGKRYYHVMMARLEAARRKGSKVLTDNPADHYFFWNFGIFPLLATLYDARSVKLGATGTPALEIKASAYVREVREYTSVHNYYTDLKVKEIIRVRVLLKAAARPEDLALLNAAHLGINSPIDVVRGMWAATPLSWLVDYFLDVGSWLNALSAPIGLTFTDGCVSTRVSIEGEATRHNYWVDSKTEVRPHGSGAFYINGFKRDVLGAFPFPGAPPVGTLLTPNESLNIGMLILQRLRK